jgi:hypothetical protein
MAGLASATDNFRSRKMNNIEQTIIREPDWSQIENFLTLIHGKLGGLIDVRAFPKAREIFSKDIAEIKEFISANIDQNICCGIASRRGPDGSKKGCGEIPGLWVDIDFKDLPNGHEDALALIEKFPLKPSLVVWSGHGLHLYWLFHEPIPASLEIEYYLKVLLRSYVQTQLQQRWRI